MEIKEALRLSYNHHAAERDGQEIPEWKMKLRVAFLQMLIKENKTSLLEIGAGTGRDSRFFMDNNIRVTAIDLSDEMVRLCGEKGVESYRLDYCDLQPLGRKFDAVWSMNSLLHVEKSRLDGVLDQIDSVLNPTGLFFMGVYGGEDFEGIWQDDAYFPKRFFSSFTDDALGKVLSCHFDIVDFKNIDAGGQLRFQSVFMRKK